MTLVQLRYFVAIADAGFNITSAAEHVHATQPGLSKQLKQLEDELGFLLFVITFFVLAIAKVMLIRAEKAKGN